jgi:hypothetical protein
LEQFHAATKSINAVKNNTTLFISGTPSYESLYPDADGTWEVHMCTRKAVSLITGAGPHFDVL